jgi:uncharacterized protein (DUF433 family)
METIEIAASVAEIAFLAGQSDKDIYRLVNEHLLPEDLIASVDHGRRLVAPLTAPIASFYFDAKDHLTAKARLDAIFDIVGRLRARPDFDRFLRLEKSALGKFDWSVKRDTYIVLLLPFVELASERATRLMRATDHIVRNDQILNGEPCFVGTRVPVANVVASADAGVPLEELVDDYPFLTAELLEDARVYVATHPRAGRPRRMSDIEPGLKLTSRKVVRPATRSRKAENDA